LTWKNAEMDKLDLKMVPRVISTISGSGTMYSVYNNYLIVAANGDGDIELNSDITTHSGGLVYMPNDDLGNSPTAFWNADWNSDEGKYENISFAPAGDGRYNMFSTEVTFAHFIRHIPLLGEGFIALSSSDTDEMGHGMRLKMTADTNTETASDHGWEVACIMCLHREKSTNG